MIFEWQNSPYRNIKYKYSKPIYKTLFVEFMNVVIVMLEMHKVLMWQIGIPNYLSKSKFMYQVYVDRYLEVEYISQWSFDSCAYFAGTSIVNVLHRLCDII